MITRIAFALRRPRAGTNRTPLDRHAADYMPRGVGEERLAVRRDWIDTYRRF